MAILLFFKEFINEKFKKKLPIPIPVELLVVILATVISFAANLLTGCNMNCSAGSECIEERF
jgi:hypothetical protein